MSEIEPHTERTVTDQRIMSAKLPELYFHDWPRICLVQIKSVETSDEEVEAKRKAIEEVLYWDYEDYLHRGLGKDSFSPDSSSVKGNEDNIHSWVLRTTLARVSGGEDGLEAS